jgi:peptide/nickel transport system permease protein
MQYVTAARALGFGISIILIISPNIMAPVIVISAANFASAILVESGLSFLGLGAQYTQLGKYYKDHYSYIIPKTVLAMVPGVPLCCLHWLL